MAIYDDLKRGPDLGLIASIVVVLSVVTIPGSFFIPLPEANDPSGLGLLVYLPILALGIGLAVVDSIWLTYYLIRRKPTAMYVVLCLSAVAGMVTYLTYIASRYL